MRRALVAIGVDKTASAFPQLKAAAHGANQIFDWAGSQGFDRVLLTDEGGKRVRHADVYDAIDAFVESGVYDQLVLYFSGHGVLIAPDCEAWLLSGAPNNQNEAINVAGSIANARTCGIGHIVVYSDACRSIPAQWKSAMLTPGTVFPVLEPRAPGPEIDVFYATLPGNPAYEVGPTQASKTHRGLLTDCLIKALSGQVPTVISTQTSPPVIPARPMKYYLAKAIPEAAAHVSIKLTQNPDARIESDLPRYLSDVAGAPRDDTSNEGPTEPVASQVADLPLGLKRTIFQVQERVFQRGVWSTQGSEELTTKGYQQRERRSLFLGVPDPDGVQSSMARILKATGRATFETRTGFTVRGVGVQRASIAGISCDVFPEEDVMQIRVNETYEMLPFGQTYKLRTAFIRFSDQSGVVLAVVPGYVGTVVVEDGQVVTVNYTPAVGSANYQEYEYGAEDLEQRRAFVAVAARNGTFRLDKATEAADYLRVLKRIDPTLGIYAAYAYAQVGNNAGVASVFEYMLREPEPVPFDVAMLALKNRKSGALNFAPGMPMLTQGWMSLGRYESSMPEPLKQARCHLKPSLWSMFSPQGMDILEKAGGIK